MIGNKKIIFLAILALAAVLIAGYFLTNKGTVSLEISDDGSEKIEFRAKTTGSVFMPLDADYPWYPTGSWAIYKFEGSEWKNILLSQYCTTPCDAVCETGDVACVQGGQNPSCKLALPEEIFEWNKKYVDIKEKDCPERTFQCSSIKDAEPGRYKIKFTYITDCKEGESFWKGESSEGNSLTVEKEFSI